MTNENKKDRINKKEIGFNRYHPMVNVLYYLLIMILTMLCFHPIPLLILFSGSFAYSILTCGFIKVYHQMKYIIFIGVMIIVINPLFNQRGRSVLFKVFNKSFTGESLVYGLLMALTILTIFLIFISYQQVVSNHKFIYVMGKILPKSAFILTMTLGYIPLLNKRSNEINEIHGINASQKFVAEEKKFKKLVYKIKHSIKKLSILITWSLESAIITGDSMKQRGYGSGKRTSYKAYKFREKDILALVLLCGMFILLIAFRLNGSMYMQIYPKMNFTITYVDLITGGLMFLFAYSPMFIDIKEELTWSYILSKN